MTQEQTKPSNEAGFVSIEILGALAVLTIILSVVYSLWSTELVEMQKRAVAKHFDMVSIAAQEYAEEKKADLLSAATTTTGNPITIQDLKDENLLPFGFNEKNPWQQTYNIYSRKNNDEKLQLIILTQGGRTHTTDEPKFGHVVVPSTAAITPIGFIPVDDEAWLRGAYGAWEEDLHAMGIPEAQRKAGHLGNVITIADASTGGDGGTVTPPVVTPPTEGTLTNIQLPNTSWDDLAGKCTSEADIGKIFFSNTVKRNGHDWNENYNGLFLCRKAGNEDPNANPPRSPYEMRALKDFYVNDLQ